jgi:hypothetical protein
VLVFVQKRSGNRKGREPLDVKNRSGESLSGGGNILSMGVRFVDLGCA